MKKKIIIISIVAIALIGIIAYISYLLSFKDISFVINSDVSEISIYKKENINNKKDPKKISSSQTIKLQTGNYVIVPSGFKISTDQIPVSITKNVEININPNYSNKYLLSVLSGVENTILPILKEKYPETMNNYKITNGTLFIKGEWYGGLLENINSDHNSRKDMFRFVAYKENNVWKIINYPELILTKSVYKTVPMNILNSINSLTSNY